MELVALQCPKCGGPVKHKESDDTYVCEYCGLAFMIKTDKKDDYEKNIKLGDNAYDKDRTKEAKHYYRLALEAKPDDWKADLMISACDLQMSTWQNYYGSRFEKALEDALKKVKMLPLSEQTAAKERIAETLNECAIYCNNTLYWDVYAAEFRYEGLDHVYDDNYEHIWDERKRPDVSSRDVTKDLEEWMLKAIDLVFEIVPKGVKLSERQLEIVETQFNYIYGCENYSHIHMGYMITAQRDRNMEKLKQHNPDYVFTPKINIEGVFHA